MVHEPHMLLAVSLRAFCLMSNCCLCSGSLSFFNNAFTALEGTCDIGHNLLVSPDLYSWVVVKVSNDVSRLGGRLVASVS